MGAWSPRLEDQRRPHGRRRLPLHRAVGRDRRGRLAAHRARRRRRRRPRCCASRCRCWPARSSTPRSCGSAALRRVPRRPDRPGQGRGRAVLGPPEGDHDEGLRPDHLRPRGAGLLPEDLRRATATTLAAAGLEPQRRPRRHLRRPGRAARTARRSGRPSTPSWPTGPALAMVDSDRGITNLHVPSDVIVDASMPAMIRSSGHMWGPDGEEADTLAVIPDSSYAGVYQVVIDDCRAHGAFDPATMGSVPNVGLMAQAAEEYGSHDKTFEIAGRRHRPGGRRRRPASSSSSRWRPATSSGCARPRTSPIRDWVKLAVTRARATGDPAVFWLDESRAHDANLIAKVRRVPARARHRRACRSRSCRPSEATALLARAHPPGREHDLGDRQRAARLPDRPVPDPGARHQRQDALDRPAASTAAACSRPAPAAPPPSTSSSCSKENYLRWDSLGEFLALAVSFEHLAQQHRQRPGPGARRHPRPGDRHVPRRGQVADPQSSAASTTAAATSTWPSTGPRSWPPRPTTPELADGVRRPRRARWPSNEQAIVDELLAVQGSPVDIGGYYQPDPALAEAVMRPSATFNAALAALG